MKAKQVSSGSTVIWVAIFEEGDEFLTEMNSWIEKGAIEAASISGVGGFQEATLAYFNTDTHSYEEIPVPDQVELLSLVGDITTASKGYQLHAHAVCGRRDGSTIGGHVRRATIRPTLELVITQAPDILRRRHDPHTGLDLIDLDDDASRAPRAS